MNRKQTLEVLHRDFHCAETFLYKKKVYRFADFDELHSFCSKNHCKIISSNLNDQDRLDVLLRSKNWSIILILIIILLLASITSVVFARGYFSSQKDIDVLIKEKHEIQVEETKDGVVRGYVWCNSDTTVTAENPCIPLVNVQNNQQKIKISVYVEDTLVYPAKGLQADYLNPGESTELDLYNRIGPVGEYTVTLVTEFYTDDDIFCGRVHQPIKVIKE